MSVQYTFSIIKPDAVERNLIGKVNSYLENAGLKIVAQKMIKITRFQAEKFYDMHRSRPFFGELIDYITSAPVVVQVLKGENAVLLNREIMGATNPKEATEGTVRKELGLSIDKNSIHGSDSEDSARSEIALFFHPSEILF